MNKQKNKRIFRRGPAWPRKAVLVCLFFIVVSAGSLFLIWSKGVYGQSSGVGLDPFLDDPTSPQSMGAGDPTSVKTFSLSEWAAQLGTTFQVIASKLENVAQWAKNFMFWTDKFNKDSAAALAWRAAISSFLNQLAYDTATYLATGDKGQSPMFRTDSIGDYLKDTADSAAGKFFEELGKKGPIAFNLCEPDARVMLKINLDLRKKYQPEKPACTVTEMTRNWEKAISSPNFLVEFQNYFEPNQNPLGVALSLNSIVEERVAQEVQQQTLDQLISGGWKAVTENVSGKIKTPSELVAEQARQVLNKSDVMERTYTGDAIADAIGIFIDTLVGKLFDQWFNKGLVSDFPDYSYNWGGLRDYTDIVSGGIRTARLRFRNLIEPEFGSRGDYNILAELTTCPDPAKAGPTNCVISEKFRQAIANKMTVGQALREGYLNMEGKFGFEVGGDPRGKEPNFYDEDYPYRSIIILRKFRIVPVAWEVATQYIKDYEDLKEQTFNLGQLVACYSPSDDYAYKGDYNYGTSGTSWCQGLIDPDWVLKAPLNFCRRQGYGPEIVSEQIAGQGAISQLAISRGDNYCADEQACIKENSDGSCEIYGYCTEERRSWNFNAAGCEAKYNSCQAFRARDGSKVSYLKNTLDYGVCNADNVGCDQYAASGSYDNNSLAVNWNNNSPIFFDRDLESCNSSAEGCHEFLRTKPGLGANLLPNSNFEEIGEPDLVGDGAADSFSGWPELQGQAESDSYSGQIAARLDSDLIKSAVVGPVDYNVSAEVYTLSFYSKNCSGGSFGINSQEVDLIASGDSWQLNSFSYVYPSEVTPASNQVEFAIRASGCLIDAVKLERGQAATAYSDYGASGRVYQKLLPQYLSGLCYEDSNGDNFLEKKSTAPAACANYVRACTSQEVGCQLYTSIRENWTVPAKINIYDYCPAECVGYDTYIQDQTTFDSRRAAYFIPKTASRCSAQAVGCDQFTNLDELERGGEGIEYFSYLRQCVKPAEGNCADFYAWEGSEESGFQLKVNSLNSAGSGQAAKPALTADDSTLCNETIYNLPPIDPAYNPDCREFYNRSGGRSYHLYSYTVSCDNNCHPYRRSEVNLNPDTGEADCLNNGRWDASYQACIYQAIPEQGNRCSASQAGCREYLGNQGNNSRILFHHDFEQGNNENWSNGTIATESVRVSQHSLRAAGGSIAQTVGQLVQTGKSYVISFIAKADGAGSFNSIAFLNSSSQRADFVLAGSGVTPDLTAEWRLYEFNLERLIHQPEADDAGVDDAEMLSIVANGDFYLDDIRLTEIIDRYYLIKNSWQMPKDQAGNSICDWDLVNNQAAPLYSLGCEAYRDQERQTLYLRDFTQLCQDSAVGCELMIDTANYNDALGAVYNAWCSLGSNCDVGTGCACLSSGATVCTAGFGQPGCYYQQENLSQAELAAFSDLAPDSVKVGADQFIYVAFDSRKQCNQADKGCQRLGLSYEYDNAVVYDGDAYSKNNPNSYESILCQQPAVACEEWSADNTLNYFKDPGDELCEWRQSQSAAALSWGWFKKKVGRCDNDSNGLVSEADPVCLSSANCVGDCVLDSVDRPCPTELSSNLPPKTVGLGGPGNRVDQPQLDNQGDSDTANDTYWAGLCPANQSGCTELIDPVSLPSVNIIFNSDFTDLDGDGSSGDGWTGSGDQTVKVEPYTLYVLDLSLGSGASVHCPNTFYQLNSANRLIPITSGSSIGFIGSDSIRFYSANNDQCTVSGGATGKQVELRETIVNYQLKQGVSAGDCNGIVDYSQGCVLFNQREQTGINKSALVYDADVNLSGGAPKSCLGNPSTCDANQLLKVSPDRVCDKWLACRSAVEITNERGEKENVCFDIGVCDGFDELGRCQSFPVIAKDSASGGAKVQQVNRYAPSQDIEAYANVSGYSKVGLTGIDDLTMRGDYHLGVMEQTGEVTQVPNGNFEFFGTNLYPLGWLPYDHTAWKASLFSVINNPISAQEQGIRYGIEGRGLLKYSGENVNTSPVSEYIDVEPGRDYVISFYVNTLNLKSKDGSGDVFAQVKVEGIAEGGIINAEAGRDWQLKVGQFKAGAASRIKIHLGSAGPSPVGNIYLDNLKIRPALEVRTDWYTPQTCRLYAQSDSLSCDYYDESGKRQKGWSGYCLEYDRYPGSEQACLLWWPVDKVKGEGIEEGAGYSDRFPLYYCTELAWKKVKVKVVKEVPARLTDCTGKCYSNSPAPFYPNEFIDKKPWIEPFLRQNFVNNIKAHILPLKDTNDWCSSQTWGCGSGICGYYGKAVFNDDGALKQVNSQRCDSSESHSDSWSMAVQINLNIPYCKKLVQVVTPTGQNKFWSSRVYAGSDFAYTCQEAYSNAADATTAPQICAYDADYPPFGSIVAPAPDNNPYEWDSKEQNNRQPLYYEFPDTGLAEPYQPRAGQGQTNDTSQRLFAQSYGEWEWQRGQCVVGTSTPSIIYEAGFPKLCDEDSDCGGDCGSRCVINGIDNVTAGNIYQGFCNSNNVCKGGCKDGSRCNNENDCNCDISYALPGNPASNSAYQYDSILDRIVYLPESYQENRECKALNDGVCDNNIINPRCLDGCLAGSPCPNGHQDCESGVCVDGSCEGGFRDGQSCRTSRGNKDCKLNCYELASDKMCGNGQACTKNKDCPTCSYEQGGRYQSVDTPPAMWIPPVNICALGNSGFPTRPTYSYDSDPTSADFMTARCEHGGLTGNCFDCPSRFCDYCGVPPRVENIKVNNQSGQNQEINKNGFVKLTFNTFVDSQQLPLVMYSIDWGDSATVVSGVEMRDRRNPGEPHSLYHLYDYWNLKSKASELPIQCGSDCKSEGFCADYTGAYCRLKPKIKIKDNWGWCNNGVNNEPCPAGDPATESVAFQSCQGGDRHGQWCTQNSDCPSGSCQERWIVVKEK